MRWKEEIVWSGRRNGDENIKIDDNRKTNDRMREKEGN